MKPTDTEEQCLIEYDGQWFLLQRYLKGAALAYFHSVDEQLSSDPGYLPAPLPPFLISISDPSELIFYKARSSILPASAFRQPPGT